jgi:hypothetical protein
MQHDIGWRRAEFGHQLCAGASRHNVDTASNGEDLRVVVATESVRPPLDEAVHHLHPGIAGRGQQTPDVGHRLASCLLGEHRESRVRTDDGTLALLCDDRGVFGCHKRGEVGSHADAIASVGGTS